MSNNDEIVWEDPPANGAGRPTEWPDRVAPLRERPGAWAKFGPYKSNNGTNVRRRIGEGFEIIQRKLAADEYYVYIRYVGGES